MDREAALLVKDRPFLSETVTLGSDLLDIDDVGKRSLLWHLSGKTTDLGHSPDLIHAMGLEQVIGLSETPYARSVISELIGNVYHGMKTSFPGPVRELLWTVCVFSSMKSFTFYLVMEQSFVRPEDWQTLLRIQARKEEEGIAYLKSWDPRLRDRTFHNSSGSGLRMFYYLQSETRSRLRYSLTPADGLVTELGIDIGRAPSARSA